jgi:hypothetical protein
MIALWRSSNDWQRIHDTGYTNIIVTSRTQGRQPYSPRMRIMCSAFYPTAKAALSQNFLKIQ